jgi:hypothetical protein
MEDDQNVERSQEDEKSESSQEEMNDNILQQPIIEPIETTNPKSEIQKSEIENMEVHHHPDLHDRKKHWKEYFLEFLMIFLAVTLGFFAESLRENLNDRKKEKEYMYSMLNDLKQDTVQMNRVLNANGAILKGLDTLLNMLSKPHDDSEFIKQFYAYNIVYTFSYWDVHFSEITISQLKNNGGLNTIVNKKVADKIMEYDVGKDACLKSIETLDKYYHIVEATQKDIFDFSLAKPLYDKMSYLKWTAFLYLKTSSLINEKVYLKSTNRNLLSRYYDDVLFYQTSMSANYEMVQHQNQLADSVIYLIRAEYHIEK